MAVVVLPLNCHKTFPTEIHSQNLSLSSLKFQHNSSFRLPVKNKSRSTLIVSGLGTSSDQNTPQDEEVNSAGVKAALCILKFYKREISPFLPKSCRYVPTCSEYSMEAYKKYGVAKGTVLTVWRICRCNPLGGSGFDPPRWFDERSPPDSEA